MRGRSHLAPPRYGFKAPKRAWKGELSYQKWREAGTPAFPSQRKRVLEVIRSRLKEVVGVKFIDSVRGIDELWNRRRRLSDYAKATSDKKVRDPLSLHDILD